MSIVERFKPVLKLRKQQHLYRTRPLVSSAQSATMQIDGQLVSNFSSNDYLGLANHPSLKQIINNANELSYGSGSAHLVTGHHQQHHLLEQELASWLGVERALIFSTGYMANLAVIPTLMQKNDLILADKLCHASLIDASLSSKAQLKRYPHLDMTALEKRLIQAAQVRQQVLIVTDGVFSMDGDIAPLTKIKYLAKQYNAWLYVDDAHGVGVLGKNGKGIFEHFSQEINDDTIVMATLGKAFGCSGAFVAGSNVVIETLIQFARPYIYTTAMSPINAKVCRQALSLVKNAHLERKQLQRNIQQFKQGIVKLKLSLIISATPIQAIILIEAKTAVIWSEKLKKLGFWVGAIRPPTVPKNTARLRVTLCASHTSKQIDDLLTAIKSIGHL